LKSPRRKLVTKKKDPKDLVKNNPFAQKPRTGPLTKECAMCKKVMHRENYQHHAWVNKKYCSTTCSYQDRNKQWGKFGTRAQAEANRPPERFYRE
jgi:hypothetical protein